MAEFDAILYSTFARQATPGGWSPSVSDYLENNFQAAGIDAPRMLAEAADDAGTSPVAISNSATDAAVCHLGFRDFFYGRLIILPGAIDVGNLVSNQVRVVEVWNSFLDESQVLSSIDLFDLDGVTISPQTGKTFAPLESATYQVSLSTAGAPQFDGHLLFGFELEDRAIPVTGRRVIAWPFAHNWSSPVNESVAYLTDVLLARKRGEQRRRIRGHARRTFEITNLISDARQRRRAEALQFGWHGRIWALPIPTDVVDLGAEAEAGTRELQVATRYRDFEAGGLCMIKTDAHTFEVVEIEKFDDDTISLQTNLVATWPQGAQVFPVRLAWLPEELQTDELTATVESFRTVWEIDASEITHTRVEAAGARTMYRGAEVFTRKNSPTDARQLTRARAQDVFDFQTGIFSKRGQTGTAAVGGFDFRVVLTSRAEIADFWAWVDARAGQHKPSWVVSWNFDFEMVAGVSEGTATLRVEEFGFAQMINAASHRRDLAFVRADGSIFYRRILGATVDGDEEVLTLDANFDADYEPEDFDRVSFLRWARLDQDSITMSWITDDKATASFRFVDVIKTP